MKDTTILQSLKTLILNNVELQHMDYHTLACGCLTWHEMPPYELQSLLCDVHYANEYQSVCQWRSGILSWWELYFSFLSSMNVNYAE